MPAGTARPRSASSCAAGVGGSPCAGGRPAPASIPAWSCGSGPHRPSAAVTIRAIVERVGVTPPSLYRHFGSKEELVRQAVARRFDALVRGITECQQAGAARSGDARYLALLTWSGLHGLATLIAARPHIDWPPDHLLVDDLLAGLVGLPTGR